MGSDSEYLSLVDISRILNSDYDIEITDRSLGRYRNEFPETFNHWVVGVGKKRRYKRASVEAFKMVVDLKAQNANRQDIQNALIQTFGIDGEVKTDRSTTDRQEEVYDMGSLVISDDIKESFLSIPTAIDRLTEVIEQQKELLRRQDERISELEKPWYRKVFRRKNQEENQQ